MVRSGGCPAVTVWRIARVHARLLNYHRRHLTDGAKELAAGRYKEIAAKEAAARKSAGQKSGGRGRKKLPGKTAGKKSGDARDVAGAKFGVSGKTVDAAAKVLKKAAPEVVKAIE